MYDDIVYRIPICENCRGEIPEDDMDYWESIGDMNPEYCFDCSLNAHDLSACGDVILCDPNLPC